MDGFSTSRPNSRSGLPIALCLALSLAPCAAAAQRPDTVGTNSGRRDTIVTTLPVLEVRASIAPAAGPRVGSGVPARISVVDQESLDRWRPRMLDQALHAMPGVSSYDDLGSPLKQSIAMRGFTVGPTVGLPQGVSVFVDGVRQNEPDAQEVNFDLLPMEFVNRIELLSGNASLLGPNAIGGAINLITDRGTGSPHGTIEAGAASFGGASLRGTAAGSTGAWSYFAGASGDRADGWRLATRSDGARGFAHASTATAEHGLDLEAYAARSSARTAGSLPESMFDVSPRVNFTAGDLDVISDAQLSASGFLAVAGGRVSATAFVRGSRANRFNANQPPDPNVRGITGNVSEGLNVDWRRTVPWMSRGLDLRAGMDASADQVRVRLFDLPATGGGGSDSLATDVSSPRMSAAAYLLADAHVSRTTLSLGARADVIHTPFDDRLDASDVVTAQTYRRITPRAGVSVDLGGGSSIYASAGGSFRAPALLELGCADPAAACPLPFALGDDPPLAPVSATNYEIGGQSLLGTVLVRGSLYRTDVRNEIFFVASPRALLAGYFTNIARTRRSGGEIDAQGAVGEHVSWYAGYAVTRATFESSALIFSIRSDDAFANEPYAGDNAVKVGDAMPLVPAGELKAGASLRITPAWSLGADARRIGRQWLRGDEANQTPPLAPYSTLDARANLSEGEWELGLVVRNVLDSHAPVFGTFNENRQSGRLERFFTPLEARTVRLEASRSFGSVPD